MDQKIDEYKKALVNCKKDIHGIIDKYNCNPILVRLAWHDSGTYDSSIPLSQWPKCGGANASIIYDEELAHGANAGLDKAVRYLKPLKKKYEILSFADIIQMASAEAIKLAGGPSINMIYGRIDATECPKEGNLPAGMSPFPKNQSPGQHLRSIFNRMGFNDQEIVALSGAHTLGRGFKERSGIANFGYGPKNGTKYTDGKYIARKDEREGVGMAGGMSWTKNWLKFDNSYFTEGGSDKKQLFWLQTDAAVKEENGFKNWFDQYAKDEALFFEDYAKVHKKLSELGSKFFLTGGISIENFTSKL